MSHESMLSCANICAPYSAVGILFMFWVYIMLTKQPFYIIGLEGEEELCAENAKGAVGLFVVTFISSITFIKYDSWNNERWEAITMEEDRELLPRGMSQYNVRTHSEIELLGVTSLHDDDQIDLPEIS